MFTIIVPVYNEEDIIVENTKKLIDYLDGLKTPYEVIICSNGSTDSTNKLGRKLEDRFPLKVRFFSIPERGVGLAFKKAVDEAAFGNLISIDIDLTTDMDFIKKASGLLIENDVVIGSKKVGIQKRTLFRKTISGGFILLVKLLLKMNYTDYSIGAKAYRLKVIKKWVGRIDYGSSYVIELIFFAKKSGLKIVEIPVYCDDNRKSRFNLAHEVIYRFINLLKLWYGVHVKGSSP
jgi:glycosyltransferase involved in cell wall biosynthesis